MTETLAQVAMRRLVDLGYSSDFADIVVSLVMQELRDPDRDMLDAGLSEFELAFGPPTDRYTEAYRRERLKAIWHAMMNRTT